jgi:hypothetical protein
MPSDIAVVRSLTYEITSGGATKDLQAWPRIFLQIHDGAPWFSPEARGDDSTVPSRIGQIARARKAHRLSILLKGPVSGQGADEDEQRADTADALLELVDLFDSTKPPRELSCLLPNGSTATITARAEIFLPEAYPEVPTSVEVQVRLMAIDPPTWEITPP